LPEEKVSSDPGVWIETVIKEFIDHSPENTLKNRENEKAWNSPLVGFSSGGDPIYEDYRDHVGPFCLTPWEISALTFSDLAVKSDDLTVISWILPQTNAAKADNRKESVYPSERWARSRIFGEEVNDKLRRHVVETLRSAGYQAVAPVLTPQFCNRRISPKHGLASTWSERHAAYASGLGTFGLCDGLITPLGKAIRTGSVVARVRITPTPRPYTDHREYCLFFSRSTCGKCIGRCPAGAISEAGKDKRHCFAHLYPVSKDYIRSEYGFEGHGCGLCQTGVPCESRIPVKT
jgi:hypothetical protein